MKKEIDPLAEIWGRPIDDLSKVELQKALRVCMELIEASRKKMIKLRDENNQIWERIINESQK